MEFGELTGSAFDTPGNTSDVVVRVNATHDDVRLVRLLASGVASQAGFSIDEIEAARLVVDEACVILLDVCDPEPASNGGAPRSPSPSVEPEASATDALVVRCERTAGAVRVTASRPGAIATSDPLPVSTRVLDGLAAKWSVHLDGAPSVMVLMRASQQLDGSHD